MNPEDTRLIQAIEQVTHGGVRLLVTLARRGKALERDDPERAKSLLAAVMTHPLYKGGRLTFDMLEIEDLMLDGPRVESMSTHEVIQVLSTGAHQLGDALKRMGSPEPEGDDHDGARPAIPPIAHGAPGDAPVETTTLPRLSLGPEDEASRTTASSTAEVEDSGGRDSAPELRSSDYLYGYVVLGWLDVAGGITTFH